MAKTYSYACKDYLGMEDCPGYVVAASKEEVWKLVELHAATAHGEDPSKWSEEDKTQLTSLIKSG
jgi:predicted small metal-binding protein